MPNTPFDFGCFDTEDDSKELLESGRSGFDKQVTQIAAITADGAKFYNKGNVEQFKSHLRRSGKRFWYAHNLQYDLGNLFGDKLDELDCTMVSGRLIKAVWGKITFVDSFNIWPMKAELLGEAFGIKKLKTMSMATDKAYVFRDVEIIWQAMLFAWEFALNMGLPHLPPTLGGLCVKLWQHWQGENVHDSSDLSRAALFGGRVELFKVADDQTWQLNDPSDIYGVFNNNLPDDADSLFDVLEIGRKKSVCWTDLNSLYPTVMCGKFPGILEHQTDLTEYGLAQVTFHQPKTDIATLPWRSEDGRILYPCGKFTGTWTIAELREAEKRGGKILKVHQVSGTNESIMPYATFVTRLYEMRLAAKSDAEKLFFKLLMNNLYGRLGSSGVIGRSVWQNERNKYDGTPYGDKVLLSYQMPLSEETNWSHAAHVTAYGRLELLRYMSLIGVKAMIYCDTDSTVFDCPGKKIPFECGKALGQMKLESWENCALPMCPKMYRIGKTYKAKGVPKRLAQKFIETGRADFDLPFKMREAIRFFDRGNARRLSVWRKVQKIKQTNYDKKRLIGQRFFPCNISAI